MAEVTQKKRKLRFLIVYLLIILLPAAFIVYFWFAKMDTASDKNVSISGYVIAQQDGALLVSAKEQEAAWYSVEGNNSEFAIATRVKITLTNDAYKQIAALATIEALEIATLPVIDEAGKYGNVLSSQEAVKEALALHNATDEQPYVKRVFYDTDNKEWLITLFIHGENYVEHIADEK